MIHWYGVEISTALNTDLDYFNYKSTVNNKKIKKSSDRLYF
jgi:hypothetical protein